MECVVVGWVGLEPNNMLWFHLTIKKTVISQKLQMNGQTIDITIFFKHLIIIFNFGPLFRKCLFEFLQCAKAECLLSIRSLLAFGMTLFKIGLKHLSINLQNGSESTLNNFFPSPFSMDHNTFLIKQSTMWKSRREKNPHHRNGTRGIQTVELISALTGNKRKTI